MSSSNLKIGIVGLPNVGKSTLFNALTRKEVDISNYPFCTIEPNVGIVEVPDERLGSLAAMARSRNVVPAVIEFVDIAGLVKGAAEGEGLGSKFLSHIRATDAIAEVVRVFGDTDIIHVAETVDPVSDIEVVEYELMLSDLETAAKRIEAVERDARARKKGAEEEKTLLEEIEAHLKKSRLARTFGESDPKKNEAFLGVNRTLGLLTAKPIIYVFNVSENDIQDGWKPEGALKEKIGTAPYVVISSKIESELAALSAEEKKEFLAALGQNSSGLDRLIRACYDTLGLITFFTTGEDETRAWTIPRGARAPRAGRAIHSDFEEKFIRAEVIHSAHLLEDGSYAKARELGHLRTEGKEYTVKDGDVIEFRI